MLLWSAALGASPNVIFLTKLVLVRWRSVDFLVFPEFIRILQQSLRGHVDRVLIIITLTDDCVRGVVDVRCTYVFLDASASVTLII